MTVEHTAASQEQNQPSICCGVVVRAGLAEASARPDGNPIGGRGASGPGCIPWKCPKGYQRGLTQAAPEHWAVPNGEPALEVPTTFPRRRPASQGTAEPCPSRASRRQQTRMPQSRLLPLLTAALQAGGEPPTSPAVDRALYDPSTLLGVLVRAPGSRPAYPTGHSTRCRQHRHSKPCCTLRPFESPQPPVVTLRARGPNGPGSCPSRPSTLRRTAARRHGTFPPGPPRGMEGPWQTVTQEYPPAFAPAPRHRVTGRAGSGFCSLHPVA